MANSKLIYHQIFTHQYFKDVDSLANVHWDEKPSKITNTSIKFEKGKSSNCRMFQIKLFSVLYDLYLKELTIQIKVVLKHLSPLVADDDQNFIIENINQNRAKINSLNLEINKLTKEMQEVKKDINQIKSELKNQQAEINSIKQQQLSMQNQLNTLFIPRNPDPISFCISTGDNTNFIGFKLLDPADYATRGPYIGFEGVSPVKNLFSELKDFKNIENKEEMQMNTLKGTLQYIRNSNLKYPEIFQINLKIVEGWGEIFSPIDGGFANTVKFSKNIKKETRVPETFYLEVFRESQNEIYVLKSIEITVYHDVI